MCDLNLGAETFCYNFDLANLIKEFTCFKKPKKFIL